MNKSNHIVKQTEGRRLGRREKGKKETEKGREGKEKEGKTNFFKKKAQMAHKHKSMFNLISNQESDHLNPTEMPFYTYTHWQGFDGNQLCVRTRSHRHPPARLAVAVVQLLSRVRFFATP